MTDDTTLDVFLGGRLRIRQPRTGYRAATDPILLAAAVGARAGDSILELGCGVGVALLALGRRVGGLGMVGVERQEAYATLARVNARDNGIDAMIETADLMALPPALRVGFDHVLTNPPFYRPDAPGARDLGRDAALREDTPLADWLGQGVKRVRSGGYLTLIHLAERLPEILTALHGPMGAIAVRPLTARTGRAAGRVLVQARKGAKGPFRLLAPLVLHSGDRHLADGDDFSPTAQALLRDAQALDWD